MEKYYYFTFSIDGKKPRRLGINGDTKFKDLDRMNYVISALLRHHPTAEIKKYQVKSETIQIG